MKLAQLTRTAHTSAVVVPAVLLSVLAMLYAFMINKTTACTPDSGLIFYDITQWIPGSLLNFIMALSANIVIVVSLSLLNKQFNFLRNPTWLYATFFAIMQASVPAVSCNLSCALVLAMAVMIAALLLFGQFNDKTASEHVFLVFLIFSVSGTCQYAFLLYLPVMAVWCVQLRIASLRTYLAAFMGIVTPWWILLGLGIVSPEEVRLPVLDRIIWPWEAPSNIPLMTEAAISSLVLILTMSLNFFKSIAYNARSRAMNGALSAMALATVLFMFIDFEDFYVFIPILNACAALQSAHYFSAHQSPRSVIGIISIIVIYIGLYLWQIII